MIATETALKSEDNTRNNKNDEQSSSKERIIKWTLDTGCSSHYCNDLSVMRNVQEIKEECYVYTADGTKLRVKEIGEVYLPILNSNSVLRLYPVKYVPTFTHNLISVSQLIRDNRNINVRIVKSGAEIIRRNKKIATAKEVNKLYEIKYKHIKYQLQGDEVQALMSSHTETKPSMNMLHYRLGHLSWYTIRDMVKNNSVEGLNKEDILRLTAHMSGKYKLNTTDVCEDCAKGKGHRKEFKRYTKRQPTNAILERISSDLSGPVDIINQDKHERYISKFGYPRYLSLIIDEHSRYMSGRILNTKSEAKNHIKEFIQEHETRTGFKVKHLLSDGGTEYTNLELTRYCVEKGIKIELTSISTPQHNSKTERANRSIFELARAMLLHARLPIVFWGHAVLAAIYILNRRLNKNNNKEKTPYELWFGKKPNLKHLRVFGCDVYYHTNQNTVMLSKFDERMKKAIFIGYDEKTIDGYLCYDPVTNNILTRRCVIFEEEMFTLYRDIIYYSNPNYLTQAEENQYKEDINEDMRRFNSLFFPTEMTVNTRSNRRNKISQNQNDHDDYAEGDEEADMYNGNEDDSDEDYLPNNNDHVDNEDYDYIDHHLDLNYVDDLKEYNAREDMHFGSGVSAEPYLEGGHQIIRPHINTLNRNHYDRRRRENNQQESQARRKERPLRISLSPSRPGMITWDDIYYDDKIDIFNRACYVSETNMRGDSLMYGGVQDKKARRVIKYMNNEIKMMVALQVHEKDKLKIIALYKDLPDPKTYEEAMASPDKKMWIEAMNEEMKSLKENNTWELVEVPQSERKDVHVIGCKWVYKKKLTSSGEIERYKARLVAKGYSQQYGIDFHDTFAPVMKYKSMRIMLYIANRLGYELEQLDVVTAFLNGKLKEVVYMEQPQGYQEGNTRYKICKLVKSLYGTKQAPREWNNELNDFLIKVIRMKRCVSDPCLYLRKTRSQRLIILGVFVDDMLVIYHMQDKEEWKEIKEKYKQTFKIKELGSVEWLLGMKIERKQVFNSKRNKQLQVLSISQEQYFDKVLKKFKMDDSKPSSTPESLEKLTLEDAPASEEEKKIMTNLPYRSAVGSLMYGALGTRPDITHAVNEVSRYLSNPGQKHWQAVKRIMRYIKGHVKDKLIYQSYVHHDIKSWMPCVETYTDADWGGDLDTRKSTTGYIIKIDGNTISWTSRRQASITLSTAEAEYMAITDATKEVLWTRQLIKEIMNVIHEGDATYIDKSLPYSVIYTDNQAAKAISENDTHHNKTKHIDIRYRFIQQHINNKDIKIEWIPTQQQQADILTKAVSKQIFIYLKNKVMQGEEE